LSQSGSQSGATVERHVERRAQGLPDKLELVERANDSHHRRRIGALTSPRLEPAPLLTALQQAVEQDVFEASLHQPRPKFTQRRVVESFIAAGKSQGVLPVNAGAHGLCRLSVAQILEQPASPSPALTARDAAPVALRWRRPE
jgi:hypothetical protein